MMTRRRVQVHAKRKSARTDLRPPESAVGAVGRGGAVGRVGALSNGRLWQRCPSLVGIELGNRFRLFNSVFPKVLLVDHAVLVDDKRHDARIVVGGGICDVGATTRHLAVDDIVLRATLGIRPLLVQYAEVVTVEWLVRV